MMKSGFLGFSLLFTMATLKCTWLYFLLQNCKIIAILQLLWGIPLASYFQLLMSIMTSTSSVYTFPIHNRLQTKNTHKLHSSPSSWLCYGEEFKESRGLFTLCGDFQMGIINIRLHISQYHIGTPQLALKLFTSCLISLTTCLQLQHLQIPMLSDS